MKTDQDVLIEVWNRLEGMWMHDNDGSSFFPKKFDDKYSENSEQNHEQIRSRGNISVLFDIIFNEIQKKIRAQIPPERQKELN
jgi:predicted GH43/DUF377 family glycosyl hydrolase